MRIRQPRLLFVGRRSHLRRTVALLAAAAFAAIAVPTATAAPALRSVSSASTSTSVTSFSLAAPSGVQSGDALVAILTTRLDGSGVLTPPLGWTLVRYDQNAGGASLHQSVFVKIAGLAEPAFYTWTLSRAVGVAGSILAYSGVDAVSPVGDVSGRFTAKSKKIIAPSVTAAPGDVVVGFFGNNSNRPITPPPGMTEQADIAPSGGGSTAAVEAADLPIDAAGPTGDEVAVVSYGSSNSSNIGQLVALQPADASASPPVDTARPVVSGSAQSGQTLTTSDGSWSGTLPMNHAYQWQRCDTAGANCADIAGATSATFTPGSADVGSTVRSAVTASNVAGAATADSATTITVAAEPSPPVSLTAPIVIGVPGAGQSLTTSDGGWSGTTPMTYTYAWQRCDGSGANCTSITGAASQTYTLGSADVGTTIRAAVTASNTAGAATAVSAQTSLVAAAPAVAPTAAALPVISGVAQAGQTLTASNGGWSGTTPMTYTYAWQRCDGSGANCTSITGAASQTYTLGSADVGTTIRAAVTASNTAGAATAVSAQTSLVAAAVSLGTSLPPPLAQSSGAVYYVATTGSDSNPGTATQPWATIQKALNTLRPGETALVRAGTYTQSLVMTRAGTATAPITVKNYPGEQPIIHPGGTGSMDYPVRVTAGAAYFRLQGFLIENAPLETTVDVWISDGQQTLPAAAHNIELSDCEVRGGMGSGLLVSPKTDSVQLIGNLFHDNGDGIHQHQGIYVQGQHTLVANNLVYHEPTGFGIQVRGEYPGTQIANGVIVVDNTSVDNYLSGIVVENSVANTTIANNISAYNGGWSIRGYNNGSGIYYPGVVAYNNLGYADRSGEDGNSSGNIIDFSNGLGKWTGPGDSWIANPLFVDATTRDYHLQSTSPAIGKALAPWSTATDLTGTPRPAAAPDLGAFER